MPANYNTFPYAFQTRRFFQLVNGVERGAVLLVANSNGRHNGNGWQYGFEVAAGDRVGRFGIGLVGGGDNGNWGDPAALPAGGMAYQTNLNPNGVATVPAGSTEASQFFAAFYFGSSQAGDYTTIPKRDFDSRLGFKWTVHYATFATGAGKFYPTLGVNGGQGYSGAPNILYWAGSPILTNTGVSGVARAVATMPVDTSRTNGDWAFQLASQFAKDNGHPPTGPLSILYNQFEQPGRTSGVSVACLAAYGGQPLRYDLYQLQNSPDLALGYYLQETRRPLGPSKPVLVFIQDAQNSRNSSVTPPQAAGDTPTQYAANVQGVINRIRGVYVLNGWSTDHLYFCVLGDHALANPDDAQMIAYRKAVVDVVLPANANTSAVDLSQVMDGDEMAASGYYTDSVNDRAHLTNNGLGYVKLAGKVWDGLASAGLPPVTSITLGAASTRQAAVY